MERPWFKHYDPGVPKDIEYPEVPLWWLLEHSANRYPEKVALEFLGKTLSYKELWESARRFAEALRVQGVKPGDRVALMLPNTPAFVIAFYGTLMAGGIAVNVNPLYTARELHHQLIDAGAETLVMLDMLWPRYAEIAQEVPVRRVITSGLQDYLPFPKNLLYPIKMRREKRWVNLPKDPRRLGLNPLLRSHPPIAEPLRPNPDDVALLQYTGGTTGISKGAMLTHRNLVANTYQTIAWSPESKALEGKGVMLGAIPFFHVYGMTVAMNFGLALGYKIVLLPRPEVAACVEAIEKHKVTHFPGVPTLYTAFNHFPGIQKRKIHTIRVCNSGSAPLPLEVMERFEQLTGGKVLEGYGLTEAAPVTHSNPVSGLRKKGSVGLPLPGVDAKILGPDMQELPPGEVGELAVRGPNIMKGYWNRPEETAKTLVIDWLLTGDMAKMDEDGYFYIVDRKKDVIIAGGYNIYPREVEEVLYAHPAIQEACVVGVPDSYRGETVAAYVVLKPGASLSEAELEKYCRENLAAFKIPRIIQFRKELPKSAVGKILRRQLREEAIQAQKVSS
ncbi:MULTISPECIES: long-chain fatty acid--CoA ligase [unclassified Meiothermus]|uniref:long-chain-fatty-acid--CoA ligase n=1 Tax=unclassified Meiothermus TaxID=370471 RepID=UPI000D7C13FC|nr:MULTISPECIES: long-chain fatty acid--CoA ligase [unclassified Meiothermus]PZA07203.1 long-chain fatty acid--CoA ligase [Meiothermus sp. Pnk-1]RYM38365.1 long-chain fatty acid--CoA ligase [Meiothermus sp. PNK-Is4]